MSTTKIIDYRDLIERTTADFVGRQWVREAIDNFLQAEGPRTFLLLGEPGCGKTAFMAQLVRERDYPHHFIGKGSLAGLESSADWRDPVRFAESLSYQLLRDYGGWIMDWESWGIHVEQNVKDLEGLLIGAQVGTFQATPRHADRPALAVEQEVERFGATAQVVGVFIEKYVMDTEQVVRQLLATPLKRIAERYPDDQIVIVVDGLDEVEGYSNPQATILHLLPGSEVPPNVRLIVSSRPGDHLTQEFRTRCQVFWLSEDREGALDQHILKDAKDFANTLAQKPEVSQALATRKITTGAFADQVASASKGNFLYLHHYAAGVRSGDLTLLDITALPQGLYGIYDDFLRKIKQKRDGVSWDGAYKPVLGVLAAVLKPFTRRQIVQSTRHTQLRPTGVPAATTATILTQVEQFLDTQGSGKDKRYAMYHISFAEFLLSDENQDLVDGGHAHAGIAGYCMTMCGAEWSRCAGQGGYPPVAEIDAGYALRYTPVHLAQAARRAFLPEERTEWGQYLHALVSDDHFRAAKQKCISNPLSILTDLQLALEIALADRDPAMAWRHMMAYRGILHDQRAFGNLQADINRGDFDAALDRTSLYRNLPNSQAMARLWIAWQAATAKSPNPKMALAAAQRAIQGLPNLARVSDRVAKADETAREEGGNALREALQRLLIRVALDAAPGGIEDQKTWLTKAAHSLGQNDIAQLQDRLMELYAWKTVAEKLQQESAEQSDTLDRFEPWTVIESVGELPDSMEVLLDGLERELAAGGHVIPNYRDISHLYHRRLAAGLIKFRSDGNWSHHVNRAVDLVALDDYPSYREMALAWVAQAVLCKDDSLSSQDARSAMASVLVGAFGTATPGFWGDSIVSAVDGRLYAAGNILDPATTLDWLRYQHVDRTIEMRFDMGVSEEKLRMDHGLPPDPWAQRIRRKSAVAAALQRRNREEEAKTLLEDAGAEGYQDSYAGFRVLSRLSLACRWLEWDQEDKAEEQLLKAEGDASNMLDPVLKQERKALIEQFKKWQASLTDETVMTPEALTLARSLAGLDLPMYLELLSALRCRTGAIPDLDALLILALEDATAADAIFGRWLGSVAETTDSTQPFVDLLDAMQLQIPASWLAHSTLEAQ